MLSKDHHSTEKVDQLTTIIVSKSTSPISKSTKMESLSNDCLRMMFKHLEPTQWLILARVSPKWRDFLDQFCYSKIKTFANVYPQFSKNRLIPRPKCPQLSPCDGLKLISRVAPNLTSIVITAHLDGESAHLKLGEHLFEMRNFVLWQVLQILSTKCTNLEDISIGSYALTSEMAYKFVENNPKLRVLDLGLSKMCDMFPYGAGMPALKEVYLSGSYEQIRGFSLFCDELTVIDLSDCYIYPQQLMDLMGEVLRHRRTLECFRVNIVGSNPKDLDCCCDLGDIQMFLELKNLTINVDKMVSGFFVAEIIERCQELEYVRLNNLDIDDDTYEELLSLPYLKEAIVNGK